MQHILDMAKTLPSSARPTARSPWTVLAAVVVTFGMISCIVAVARQLFILLLIVMIWPFVKEGFPRMGVAFKVASLCPMRRQGGVAVSR